MALPNIVDQDCYIETVHQSLQSRVIGIAGGREIYGECFGSIGPGRFGLYGFCESFEFGLCARNKKNVEASLGKLYGEFLANAI